MIDEIDVCPLQIQGPLSEDLMAKLAGEELREIPYYGLMETKINGASVVISQTGFTGEKGYEIYVRDAHENAEIVWNGVLEAGEEFGLMVIALHIIVVFKQASYLGGKISIMKHHHFR